MVLGTPVIGTRSRHFDDSAPDAVTRRSDLRVWQARRLNAVGSQTPRASTCWNLHLLHDRDYQRTPRMVMFATRPFTSRDELLVSARRRGGAAAPPGSCSRVLTRVLTRVVMGVVARWVARCVARWVS